MTPAEIAAALQRPLPGIAAQKRMMVRPRAGGFAPPPGETPREGGVLILLYPQDDAWQLPLILRTQDEGAHSGQVSLPGGRREGDESLAQTALREAQEELGVSAQSVTLLGALTPLYIPASGYCITPSVGYVAQRPDFRPDPAEVQELIESPLSLFLVETTVAEETWHFGDFPVQVPFYRVGRHKVWGATAMVLSEFTTVLHG